MPLSTAVMVLPADETAVCVRDLVELFDEQGSVGIFRVASIEDEVGLTRRVQLVHGLSTLMDGFVPAMTIEAGVQHAFWQLLAHQPQQLWQLGDLDVPADTPMVFTTGNTNLLTAVLTMADLLPSEIVPVFDQSVMPWTLHLRKLVDNDACEARMSRNLSGVRIDTDASELCTRVYPYGAGQGTERIGIEGLTGQSWLDSDAAERWGIISRSFIANSIFDAATLKAVAEKYLERHSVPVVSVTAEAVDLAAMTGESIDSFRLGRMCRLALPDAALLIDERIVCLEKPDVFGKPGLVTITLCSRIHDTADEIADMLREVIADKTLGGLVQVVTTDNRASGNPDAPAVHYFRVEEGQTVLGCTAVIDPDGSVGVRYLYVDGVQVPHDMLTPMTYDLTPHLRKTDAGTIRAGRHWLSVWPQSSVDVCTTITLRVINT